MRLSHKHTRIKYVQGVWKLCQISIIELNGTFLPISCPSLRVLMCVVLESSFGADEEKSNITLIYNLSGERVEREYVGMFFFCAILNLRGT